MFSRKPFSGAGISVKFLVVSATAITTIFAVLLSWFWNLQNEHIMEQVRKQAIILNKQIILTRQWCSETNGILMEKSAGVDSNPYLENPDVAADDGKLYTRITPSILTTLLSDKARNSELYWFKLTNDFFLNPKNSPDDLEKKALEAFRENGSEGFFQTDLVNGRPTLRYLAPVYVTGDCIQCHMEQSAGIGNIGGCLSVFIPIDGAQAAIRKNSVVVFGGGVGLALSLVGLLYLITSSLVFNRIKEIRESISHLGLTEDGHSVKQEGDELKEISDFCYMLDRRLRTEHDDLENRIKDATRDLSLTKDRLEKANRELEALNKAKTAFFSDISHELRTPLTAIKGAADIISRKSPNQSPQYLEIIKRNADHLTKLVVDFLDFSKIEDGQIELDAKESSLREIVEAAIKSFESESSAKSLSVICDMDDARFSFDSTRMFQVMTNLLSNAIRFSPHGGIINIAGEKLNDGIYRVSVQDQGQGILEKFHKDIFRKFYQVKEGVSASLQKGSSGIGLAICKGLVEAHGGRIWMENVSGAGARFLFEIPMRPFHEPEENTDCR